MAFLFVTTEIVSKWIYYLEHAIFVTTDSVKIFENTCNMHKAII
jgi:hypothetical protein